MCATTEACRRDGADLTYGWFGIEALARRAGYSRVARYVGGRAPAPMEHGDAAVLCRPYLVGEWSRLDPAGTAPTDRWYAVPTRDSEGAQFFDHRLSRPSDLTAMSCAGVPGPVALLSAPSAVGDAPLIRVVRAGSPRARAELVRRISRQLGALAVEHLRADVIAHGVPLEVTRTAHLYARFHTARTRDVRCRPADVDYG